VCTYAFAEIKRKPVVTEQHKQSESILNMTKFEQAELLRQAAAHLPHHYADLRWQLLNWSRELLRQPETYKHWTIKDHYE
jgi:hypothetical protein